MHESTLLGFDAFSDKNHTTERSSARMWLTRKPSRSPVIVTSGSQTVRRPSPTAIARSRVIAWATSSSRA